MKTLLALLLAVRFTAAAAATSQSVYLLGPDDPHAVYLGPGTFGALGDGAADDIQAAIDRVADTTGEGVVFVATARYRITRTIHLWSGIRLIGYGPQRPLFLLGAGTPGFQQGHEFLVIAKIVEVVHLFLTTETARRLPKSTLRKQNQNLSMEILGRGSPRMKGVAKAVT